VEFECRFLVTLFLSVKLGKGDHRVIDGSVCGLFCSTNLMTRNRLVQQTGRYVETQGRLVALSHFANKTTYIFFSMTSSHRCASVPLHFDVHGIAALCGHRNHSSAWLGFFCK